MARYHPKNVGQPLAKTDQAGLAQFDSTDFSVTDGVVSLSATGNLENLAADSGTLTPAAGALTIAGGNAISTSGSSATLTVAVDSNSIDTDELVEDTIQQAQVTLTAAQIKALAATQITLVAAPGAGKAVHFMGALLKLNYGSEVFTESADNLVIKYTNASGVAVSDVIECTGFIDQSADTITSAVPVKDAIVAASACENQALVIDNNGDGEFGGNASNDSTISIDVSYRVVTLA